jgi:acetylornithine/N-succinyldiaminopimelate aminotransferase
MPTTADSVFKSSRVAELIGQLKKEVAAGQKKLTSVKPPLPDLEIPYKTYIEKLTALRGRNLFYPYVGSGLGQGPYVELQDGSVKMDLINGIGIHLFGHGHPDLMEAALYGALQDVVMQGNLEPNREYGELLELLVTAAGRRSRIKKGWIGTCGTIVNENALKIVRQKNSPARKILAMKNNFAGRSTLMAEITDNPEYKVGLPNYGEVLYVPFFDPKDPQSKQKSLETLKKHIAENPKNIACFIFEPLQGEGGFNYAPADFFKPLFEVCKENHIAVWADEIQTFSRTGELFAFETLGIGEYIDIVTIAKTAQCGAVLYTEEYNPKPGLIAGTFTASTVSLSTGIKTLKKLLGLEGGEKYFGPEGKIQVIHKQFMAMLKDLQEGPCHGLIKDFGGLGLMIAMTPYDGSKEKVMKLLQVLFKNGMVSFSCGHDPYKVRFLLPLVLEPKHIKEAQSILEKSLKENLET